MDARCFFAAVLYVCAVVTPVGAQLRYQGVRTPNFVVSANDSQFAKEAAQSAEQWRRDLALHWLGQELPDWPQPCPLVIRAGQKLGAGGATRFTLVEGRVTDWNMNVQGTRERILDSVLPHEITHTILATHFARLGKPVPRWADEGACTTVEHQSERGKHERELVRFLSSGRGLAFSTMFTLRDYPDDIMPLYAQGYSVVSFLIAQGGQEGPKRFIRFLEEGMKSEDWVKATEHHYGYPKVGKLQSAWNDWVADGGGPVDGYTAVARGLSARAAGIAAANLPSDRARSGMVPVSRSPSPGGYAEGSSVALASLTSMVPNSASLTRLQDPPSLEAALPASRATQPPSVLIPHSATRPQPFQTIGGGWVDGAQVSLIR
jgi:hypothetical protein